MPYVLKEILGKLKKPPKAGKQPCCPICKRNFDGTDDDDLKKAISRLEKQLTGTTEDLYEGRCREASQLVEDLEALEPE